MSNEAADNASVVSPVPDSAPVEINVSALEQMSANERISTTELRARSHDLELLISLASVFSLASAPPQMLQILVANLWDMSETLMQVSTSLVIVLGSSLYALAALFGLHLIMRATWVAMIGLETHFTWPKSWRESQSFGPVGFEEQHRLGLAQQSNLLGRLDRAATIIFVLGVSLIVVAVSGLIGILLSMAFAQLADWLNLPLWIERLFTATLLLIVAAWLIPPMLDRHLGNRGKAAPNWLRRMIIFSTRIANFGPMLSFNRALMPLMTDKTGLVGYFLVLGIFALCLNSFQKNVRDMISGKQFSAAIETQLESGRVTRSYRDEILDAALMFPNIETVITDDPLIRLNLPIQWFRDREAMSKLCGVAFEQQLVECAKKYWTVSVDGKALTDADWLLFANRANKQIGIDVFFSLSTTGAHEIKVQRWQAPDDKIQAPLNIPVYWKQ
jgi:hypothetical protein